MSRELAPTNNKDLVNFEKRLTQAQLGAATVAYLAGGPAAWGAAATFMAYTQIYSTMGAYIKGYDLKDILGAKLQAVSTVAVGAGAAYFAASSYLAATTDKPSSEQQSTNNNGTITNTTTYTDGVSNPQNLADNQDNITAVNAVIATGIGLVITDILSTGANKIFRNDTVVAGPVESDETTDRSEVLPTVSAIQQPKSKSWVSCFGSKDKKQETELA